MQRISALVHALSSCPHRNENFGKIIVIAGQAIDRCNVSFSASGATDDNPE